MVAITEAVSLEKGGEIGLLCIDKPPVNALGFPVRKGMADGIAMAMKDDGIKAVVVICKGGTFCAGADIREFGKPPKEPHLPDVLTVFDECTKPIIAAVHGTAFGGGLETALSSHFRVAVATAQFGLPEVKLGLLPGAGGTQRLPRLIGPEKALPMVATGNPIGAAQALKEGVIDEIVEGDLAKGAVAFARKVLAEKRPLRRVSQLTDKTDAARKNPQIFADYRKQLAKTARGFEAPEACVKAVEAAVNKPFAEGLKYERELFSQLMMGSQSAAQRYYFFAERQVAKIPDIPKETPLIDIKKVGIIGAGTMGGGITMNFVNAGIPVTLVEAKQEFLDRGIGVIKKNYDITASKGKMSEEAVAKRMGLIKGTTKMED
ncbi:MAG: enoyl-CoA hydratase/isomerase family protein, partial [Desulfatitalea sp.]|nr:enoyl-CoA hydratase/isomerase family protein [Desulfatitalea sp.]